MDTDMLGPETTAPTARICWSDHLYADGGPGS